MFASPLPHEPETRQSSAAAVADLARLADCRDDTLIATDRGEMPLGRLQPGDRVLTRDNGLQEIRSIVWATTQDLEAVVIRQGGLGSGIPARDTVVSAQHRVIVTGEIASLLLDETEALIAARHLVGLAGVVPAKASVMCHMEFDHDEVVLSNGCWTECVSPADPNRGKTDTAQTRELASVFSQKDNVLG